MVFRHGLEDLAQAFDAREQAGVIYRQAEDEFDQYSIDQLGDHPEIVEALFQAEVILFDSRDIYEEMERSFRAAHYFNPLLFDHLVSLRDDTRPNGRSEAGQATSRQERLAALKVLYPGRADRLQAAYDALLAYEKVCNRFDAPRSLIQIPARPGVLEFRIAADPSEDHQDEIGRLDNHGIDLDFESDQPYRWFAVDDLGRYITDADSRAQIEHLLTRSLSTDVNEANQARDAVSEYMRDRRQVVARPYAGGLYLLLHDEPGFAMTRELQWSITTVGSGLDQLGRPTVNFKLDGRGAMLMADMTRRNTNRPMAVLLDSSILTAPIINERLSVNIQISGEFSAAEIGDLIHTMSLGLPEGRPVERSASVEVADHQPIQPSSSDFEHVYHVRGQVVQLPDGSPSGAFVVYHEPIPDYIAANGSVGMDAMVMPFALPDPAVIDGLAVGDIVEIVYGESLNPRVKQGVISVTVLPADTMINLGGESE